MQAVSQGKQYMKVTVEGNNSENIQEKVNEQITINASNSEEGEEKI